MNSGVSELKGEDDPVPSVATPTRGVVAILAPLVVGTLLSAVLIVGAYAGFPGASASPAAAASGDVVPNVPDRVRGFAVDVESGHALYMGTCSSCHGTGGEGMPMQGANLARSYFITSRTNEQLLTFLLLGRQPGDRYSVLGRAMPPRGGNPDLGESELADIVGYLRRLQIESHPPSPGRMGTIAAAASARR